MSPVILAWSISIKTGKKAVKQITRSWLSMESMAMFNKYLNSRNNILMVFVINFSPGADDDRRSG